MDKLEYMALSLAAIIFVLCLIYFGHSHLNVFFEQRKAYQDNGKNTGELASENKSANSTSQDDKTLEKLKSLGYMT